MRSRRPLEEVSVPLRAQWTWTSSSFSPQGLLPSVLWLLPEGFTWARNNRCLSRGLPTCEAPDLVEHSGWWFRKTEDWLRENNWVVRLREVKWGWLEDGRPEEWALWSEEMVWQKLRYVSCSGDGRLTGVCALRLNKSSELASAVGFIKPFSLRLKAFLNKFPSAWFPFFLAFSFSSLSPFPSVIETDKVSRKTALDPFL